MLPSQYLEKGWTQGAFARDKNYTPVNSLAPSAVSWCLTGAISIALPMFSMNADHSIRYKIEDEVEKIIGINPLEWNDIRERTQQEVIALMKQVELNLGLSVG